MPSGRSIIKVCAWARRRLDEGGRIAGGQRVGQDGGVPNWLPGLCARRVSSGGEGLGAGVISTLSGFLSISALNGAQRAQTRGSSGSERGAGPSACVPCWIEPDPVFVLNCSWLLSNRVRRRIVCRPLGRFAWSLFVAPPSFSPIQHGCSVMFPSSDGSEGG